MSVFDRVPLIPPDPILGLTAAYRADPRKEKVNLGVGLYKDEHLKTPIFQSVKTAEEELFKEERTMEYLPIEGERSFIESVGHLVFGEVFWKQQRERIAGFQTLGGTGALKLAGTFCKEELDAAIFVSSPTWPNHSGVFRGCQLPVKSYPYYDEERRDIAYEKMWEYLNGIEGGGVVVFHACCHNPTGRDPSLEQWKQLLDLCSCKRLIPLFDCAYQGLGEGVEEDAEALRLFAEAGMEMFVTFSASKNFGLYGERVGALFIISQDSGAIERIMSRGKQMIRVNYSNPPTHGARMVGRILKDVSKKRLWMQELSNMRKRVLEMKQQLAHRLIEQGSHLDFGHLVKARGMFCFTGLENTHVGRLIVDYGIYMTGDGRINVCGLNLDNLDYVVQAVLHVTQNLG